MIESQLAQAAAKATQSLQPSPQPVTQVPHDLPGQVPGQGPRDFASVLAGKPQEVAPAGELPPVTAADLTPDVRTKAPAAPRGLESLNAVTEIRNEIATKNAKYVEEEQRLRELSRTDPAARDDLATLRSERMWQMLDLQSRMQEASFGVQLVGKVVEQGTGGIKTVLQTQA